MQTWPQLRNLLRRAPSTARSRSASSKTIIGSLPPNSRLTLLTPLEAMLITRLPVSVSPVNATLETFLFEINSSPTTAPEPVTTFNAPLGSPALQMRSHTIRSASGVELAGFTTIVFPPARAGAILTTMRTTGEFHGVIATHTPTGCFGTNPNSVGSDNETRRPEIVGERPA